jgi:hypothetical protein
MPYFAAILLGVVVIWQQWMVFKINNRAHIHMTETLNQLREHNETLFSRTYVSAPLTATAGFGGNNRIMSRSDEAEAEIEGL